MGSKREGNSSRKRAIGQELRATGTGGIPILGPIRYPVGPLPWGRVKGRLHLTPQALRGGPTLGGLPPGLSLTPPPVALGGKTSKSQRHRDKEPTPRITTEEFKNVGRALDIWARLENPGGNPQIADDISFGEDAMKYAKHGEIVLLRIA